MAHFAKLDENNLVIAVHVLGNNETSNSEGVEDESIGIAYLTKIHKHPYWKKTSYNTIAGQHTLGGTPFRKNYAGIGYTYDEGRDAFIAPKPFESWTLNEEQCCWSPPVAYPTIEIYTNGDNQERAYMISWDEAGQQWTAHDWETPQENFVWNVGTSSWDSV
jgi:hypothetical protein